MSSVVVMFDYYGIIDTSVCQLLLYVLFFFFKQKTAYEMRISDWSSDVCSSDLFQSCTRGEWAYAGEQLSPIAKVLKVVKIAEKATKVAMKEDRKSVV